MVCAGQEKVVGQERTGHRQKVRKVGQDRVAGQVLDLKGLELKGLMSKFGVNDDNNRIEV